MDPDDFLPQLETVWIDNERDRLMELNTEKKKDKMCVTTKRAAYKVIGNAVCPPVIAWLAEKVVLPAGGFVVMGEYEDEMGDEKKLPVYLSLALDAIMRG